MTAAPHPSSGAADRILDLLDQGAAAAGLPSYTSLLADQALARAMWPSAVQEVAIGLQAASIYRMALAHTFTARDLANLREHVAVGRRREALDLIELLRVDAEMHGFTIGPGPLPDGVADLEEARARRQGGARCRAPF